MKSPKYYLLLALAASMFSGRIAHAQDSVKVEPIDPTVDVSKLTYDILVDGNLTQDDPANNKYKTLQAAYAAAPEGTEAKPTVIGIKPNVYQLPGPSTRGPSLAITKNWITFLGLTNNRRAVVLADNRGLQQGSEDDGYMLDVTADGFSMRNLTVVNYCNNDYEYPGDPSKSLKKRSDVITQGVALQIRGDKHSYFNVAMLGRLDTTFIQTTRSYFKNAFIEGTDDWMGGGQMSVWEDSELIYPTSHGVMSASNIIFINCKFGATKGMQFYKAEYGSGRTNPVALINCVVPAQAPLITEAKITEAKITEITGQVEIVNPANPTAPRQAVKVGDTIHAPSLLQTGPRSRAVLTAPDGTIVRVGTNTIFSIPAGSTIKPQQGSILFKSPTGDSTIASVGSNAIVLDSKDPQDPVAWVRGLAAARPNQYSLTYHTKDTNGNPAVIYDSSVGPPTFNLSRELTDQEALAFNPWNLLRRNPTSGVVDDWDPAGVRAKYANAGDLVYKMTLVIPGAGNGGGRGRAGGGGGTGVLFGGGPAAPTIRTGGDGTTFGTTIIPASAADLPVTWSTKSDLVALAQSGSKVTVTGQNKTEDPQWVAINGTAPNGFYVTAYVYCEPKFIDPPAVTTAPTITAPSNGTVKLNYGLTLGTKQDQSLITWSICDDAKGANPWEVAESRGQQPLKTLPLTPGYVGKYLMASIQPKVLISEAGPAVTVISAAPIAAADIATPNVNPNFRNFNPEVNDLYISGLWTVLGTWTISQGDSYVNGYGIRPGSAANLVYQTDADRGDMQVDVVMAPEKTEGTGFSIPGSPADTNTATTGGARNLHSDVFIKYDPRTKNGYSVRFWRTTLDGTKCMFQIYKIVDGAGSPLDDKQQLTGVFKPTTHMTLKVTGNILTVTASNDVDKQTLLLQGTITPNRFGGGGVFWPGGSSNTYSQISISYPGAAPAK